MSIDTGDDDAVQCAHGVIIGKHRCCDTGVLAIIIDGAANNAHLVAASIVGVANCRVP